MSITKIFLRALAISLLTAFNASAQTLDLITCLDSAESAMPLLRQRPLYRDAMQNALKNLSNAYLPAVTANGQFSYQSDVPSLPFTSPGSPEIDIPKDQYRVFAEVSQPIYDAGYSRAQKMVSLAGTEVNLQTLEVGLHEYQRQVIQVFFQVLLAERQQDIIERVIDLLDEKVQVAEAGYANGVLQQNDVLRIEAGIIDQEKHLAELTEAIGGGMKVLSMLTGIETEGRALVIPEMPSRDQADLSNNPEFSLIEAQNQRLQASLQLANSQRMPRISLFGQTGVGRPNPFNFFEAEQSFFYIAGIRATWTIFDWNKASRERQNILLDSRMLSARREQKEIELNSLLARLEKDLSMFQQILEKDTRLLDIREEIRANASVQLNEGVITLAEYLDEVLAEQQAGIAMTIDEINLGKTTILIQHQLGTLTN